MTEPTPTYDDGRPQHFTVTPIDELSAKSHALQEALAENERLRKELEAVTYAAHMPADYLFGLPSWINQRLYAAYIGAYFHPDVMAQIEAGTLRFPHSPTELENADLRRRMDAMLDSGGTMIGAEREP